jgi:hypothetical protein
MADIKYIVEVDTKTAQASIKEFTGEIQKSADSLKSAGETATESGGKFSGLWKQVAGGILAVEALRKGFHELTQFVGDSIKAAAEAESANRSLEAALATTGRTVEPLKNHFIALAESIQRETVYSDEAVKSAETLLLQLTNLDRQGIEAATRGAVGLASTLKIDLQTAALLVAKAMEGNTAALSRYGIRVSENLPLEEKRRQLLEQLSNLYERAKTETETYSGAQAQLKNSLDDLKEVIGDAIIKNETLRNAIKDLKDWVDKLAKSEDFKLWLSALIELLEKTASVVGKTTGAIARFGETVGTWIATKGKAKKANEEYAQSFILLREAIERARAAGHDHGNQMEKIKEAHEKSKPIINETGRAVERVTEAVKEKVKITQTAIPLWNQYASVMKNWRVLVEGEILPAARNLKDLIDHTITPQQLYYWQDHFEQYVPPVQKTTSEIKNYFDGLFNDIATGLGNLIQKWLEGGLTLKNFMKGIWEEIKQAFFRMLGEMIATELIKKLKDVLSSALDIGKSLSSAVSSAARAATSVASSVSSSIAAFSSLSMALGGLGGIANFAASIFNWLKGPEKHTDVTFWLKLIKDNSQIVVNYLSADYLNLTKGIFEKLEAINDEALSYQNRLLEDISGFAAEIREAAYGVWDVLKGTKKAQFGFEGVVTRPTLFMAGEAGPERVIVEPIKGSSEPINVNIKIEPVVIPRENNYIIDFIVKKIERGHIRIPISAIAGAAT